MTPSLPVPPLNAANCFALKMLLAEWNHAGLDDTTRISNLRQGGGLNGANILKTTRSAVPSDTVADDAPKDKCTGSAQSGRIARSS